MATNQPEIMSTIMADAHGAAPYTVSARVRTVGVREFRDHASQYLNGPDILAVARHGRTIGYYIPVAATPTEEARQALARINRTLDEMVASGAITEAELERVFDLTQPWPDSAAADPASRPA